MARRHLIQRFSPGLDRRWLLALLIVGVIGAAVAIVYRDQVQPPLELLALAPDGTFADSVAVPAAARDTVSNLPDGVSRVPLVFGVRNPGTDVVRPERLELSLPARFRLRGSRGEGLLAASDPSSPLVTYSIEPGLDPVEPERLPELLPAHDTLWLEIALPAYHCIVVADSIPDFVVADPPPASTVADVRIFYSFLGGDLSERQTGLVTVRLDTMLLQQERAPEPPAFPTQTDRELAEPDLGALQLVGSRRTNCGEPGAGIELLSTVWEVPSGGRFITLDYGGTVRKHLFDLDDDGIIERESWDPDGDGTFETTRRARLPIPSFLLPVPPMPAAERQDSLPADTLGPDARTDTAVAPRPFPTPADTQVDGVDTVEGLEPVQPADTQPDPPAPRPTPLGDPIPDSLPAAVP